MTIEHCDQGLVEIHLLQETSLGAHRPSAVASVSLGNSEARQPGQSIENAVDVDVRLRS